MRVVVIGGGILGLAVARELHARGDAVTVCEKEDRWAAHQTGHNSNVVHAGLYYAPGSLKATMGPAGNASMVAYAKDRGVPVDVCGKLIVATSEEELPRLRALAERAATNGVPVREIGVAEAREYEPHVHCVAALRVDSTAVIDFPAVCEAMAADLAGADLRLRTGVRRIESTSDGVRVVTDAETIRADAVVNCAGLHADRVARLAGRASQARVVPFRGEYYRLRPHAEHLVRGLIYPVPNPALPFLGVHLTRMLDGEVHAGPNAVLALRREGYRWRDVSARDLAEAASFPGTWRLARRFWRIGIDEIARSVSRKRFATALARLVPELTADDIEPSPAGVRAQALDRNGGLVQDFLFETGPRQVHLINAPSPAATCALEIAKHVADRVG